MKIGFPKKVWNILSKKTQEELTKTFIDTRFYLNNGYSDWQEGGLSLFEDKEMISLSDRVTELEKLAEYEELKKLKQAIVAAQGVLK